MLPVFDINIFNDSFRDFQRMMQEVSYRAAPFKKGRFKRNQRKARK